MLARSAPHHDPDATLILYGGLGHLDGRSQPRFQTLLRSQESYRALVIQLEEELGRRTGSVTSEALRRWTSHPIARTHQDVVAALSVRLGRPAVQTDVDAVTRHFDHVLVLVLAAWIEMEIEFSMPSPVGSVHRAVVWAGVGAVLAQVGGDVLFVRPHLEEIRREVAASSRRVSALSDADLRQLYATAGSGALRAAFEGLARWSPEEMIGGWDRHMVVDYRLQPAAAAYFSDQSLVEGRCRDDDSGCHRLAGLLQFGLTDAMSEAGLLVLPPRLASEWGRAAEFKIGFTLQSDRTGIFGDSLVIRVPRDAATHAVTAKLDGFGRVARSTASDAVEERLFVAGVSAPLVDLSGRSGSLFSGIRNARSPVVARVPTGDPPLDLAARRGLYATALLNALEEAQHAMAN